MRLDRNRSADIWLGEKMIFFAIGAALGIGGIVTGHDWLVWAAIAVLIIGFALRLLGRRGSAGGEDVPPPSERDTDWARTYEPGDDPGAGGPTEPVDRQ
jgi:hypothetical protein